MRKALALRTKTQRGFTLIELLVVVALIGILATLVMANFSEARGRSRDTQRKSDLKQIATALRLYYNDNGEYPAAEPPWGEAWTAVGGTVYMNKVPSDPLWDLSNPVTVNYIYKIGSDADATDTDSYRLSACLENKSDDKGVATASDNDTDTNTTWCVSDNMYQVRP